MKVGILDIILVLAAGPKFWTKSICIEDISERVFRTQNTDGNCRYLPCPQTKPKEEAMLVKFERVSQKSWTKAEWGKIRKELVQMSPVAWKTWSVIFVDTFLVAGAVYLNKLSVEYL